MPPMWMANAPYALFWGGMVWTDWLLALNARNVPIDDRAVTAAAVDCWTRFFPVA